MKAHININVLDVVFVIAKKSDHPITCSQAQLPIDVLGLHETFL